MPCRASARMAAIWVSSTPGIDTAAEVRCLSDGTGSSAASARTHVQRLEADRPHHDQLFGDRLEQQVGLADQRRQLGLDAGRRHQLFQGLQPGAALAAECHGVGLAGRQAVDKSMGVPGLWVALCRRGQRTPGRARGSSPYLSPLSCVFLRLVVLAVHQRRAGCRMRRFRVESQPGYGWPVCRRRTAEWCRAARRTSIGCTKSVIRIGPRFAVLIGYW